MLGATVFRSTGQAPRTLVTCWPDHQGEPVTFWSSADFALLSNVSTFAAANGKVHDLFMLWSNADISETAASDPEYTAPKIPAFPAGKAAFTIVGTPPDAATLLPIQSLHDIYNSEYERLNAAWQGRERARLQHEADLQANPPRPKDIVLNYWRMENAAPAPAVKGGRQ